MAQISPPSSTKRSQEEVDSLENSPFKRRRLYHHRHAVRHKQTWAADPFHHSQDAGFFQNQLQRSISLVLQSFGFDGVTTNALEELRGLTEECMHYLKPGERQFKED